MRMVSNAAEPGCDVAKELWPDGCQSWVSATWPKHSVRRLMTGTTASPSATASAPPAQKSFCTSIISSKSSLPGRICILNPCPDYQTLALDRSFAKVNHYRVIRHTPRRSFEPRMLQGCLDPKAISECGGEPRFDLDMGDRFDQLACVSGFRIIEHRPALALFDDAAILQNDGPIAHHANDVEIVADKEEGQVIFTPQPVEQLQHH